MDLHKMVEAFVEKWAPFNDAAFNDFVCDLRQLLEVYGRAALQHESLPDTEHEHRDPI